MQAADMPHDEAQRLAALQALNILDTPLEATFDGITQLAREIFDVPIALVSLVDKDRQWFKSRQGLDACETERRVSFCAHAITHNAPLVVEDTFNDIRFDDNDLVSDAPFIRFYAGHPLRPSGNLPVGTLCLIDRKPRSFSEREQKILQGLAQQVEELLRQRTMREALTSTARRFEALFTKSATGKVRIDRTGNIIAVNPFALRLLGYTEDELIGRNVAILTPPDIAAHHNSFIARYLAGGEPTVIGRGREVDAQHKDGRYIPVHLAINAITNDQEEVVEFLGILTDLSDMHAANQRINKEQGLLKVLHHGITDYQALMSGERLWTFLMEALRELTDSDYALIGEVLPTDKTNALKIHAITDLAWNDESRQLMERLRSGDMMLTNPNSLLGRVFAFGEVVMTNDVYTHTLRGGFPLGHPTLSNYLGVPIFNGEKLIGMYAIANSKQLLNQELLDWLQPFTDTCALLINLYRQMAEREEVMHDLAAARDQAEKANKSKSEFLSSMSHELRTPLNAIIGFSQLLGKARRDPLSSKQQRQIGQIEKSGQHLLSLINEVLDLARIEAGQMALSIEPMLIKNVIDDACSTLEATMEAANITLIRTPLPAPCQVIADYTRVKQVLLNLLSNAIKYNCKAGNITITAEQGDEHVRINIADTGSGIPPHRHHELFEPFNRLDAEYGAVEGTGIGLAITRQLIERMDGQVGVDSALGCGATFWFTLPNADPSAYDSARQAPGDTSFAINNPRAYKLLYIEDNPTNQRLMEDIIEEIAELQLVTASSAEIGLEMMRQSPPDVVLMDIHLPGMNGFQALDIIQKDKQLRGIHIIALSSNAMERDIKNGLAAGFDAYLTKPLDINRLASTLNKFIDLTSEEAP
ncbi:MAG: GAF domain-containing protein [Halomonas sp.]|nr:ATP-binding protein [Halomonas sp.]MBP5978827.1 GAF domain-containing protein [Halomonas sp.]